MLQDTPRILYVEDNPLNMTLVRKSLHFLGYPLLEAINGSQGINLALRYLPDLVLMDLHLPDTSGLQVAALLRQNPATQHVGIVALTADSVDDPASWCRDNDFDGFLTKPVSRTALLHTIQYWVGQSQQRSQEAMYSSDLEDTELDMLHLQTIKHPIKVRKAE